MAAMLTSPMLRPVQAGGVTPIRTAPPMAGPKPIQPIGPRTTQVNGNNPLLTGVAGAGQRTGGPKAATGWYDNPDPSGWTSWGSPDGHQLSWDGRLVNLARLYGTLMYPGAVSAGKFSQELEPQRQAMIRRMLLATSPGNRAARIATQGNINTTNALASSRRLKSTLAGQGFGDSVMGGADVSAVNQANAQTADFANNENSTEGQMRGLLAQLGVVDQGQQSQIVKELMQVIGLSQGADLQFMEAANKPNPLWGAAGGILGSWAGTGFK